MAVAVKATPGETSAFEPGSPQELFGPAVSAESVTEQQILVVTEKAESESQPPLPLIQNWPNLVKKP